MSVVRDVKLHKFVEATKAVSKRSILYALFISYDKVIQSF